MSTIHFFGCSLVYGSEIDGEGITVPSTENIKFTWPILLAKRLNYDNNNIKIWARPGSSPRDIAFNAIDAMHKSASSDDIFVICWTWPERTNYWDIKENNINQDGLIVNLSHIMNPIENFPIMKNYPKLIQHFKEHETARNWVLNFLQNFYTVENTANMLKCKCIHIQIGETIKYLNDINDNFFSNQVVPHARYCKDKSIFSPEPSIIENHILFNTWLSANIIFRDKPLWYLIDELYSDRNIYNGTHWNITGSQIVSDVVYEKIKDMF